MTPFTPTQKKLLVIFALFFIPLFIATVWYGVMPAKLRPQTTTNNGQLIEPPRPLEAFETKTLSGEPYTVAQLETVWTLVHLLDAPCDADCSKSLYETRQIRIALGKDIDRVQRVIVVENAELAQSESKMWASHPDMSVVIASEHGLGQQIRAQVEQHAPNTVYLVDPLGNIMMSFPPDLNPKLLMKDLRKLLRLSQIG